MSIQYLLPCTQCGQPLKVEIGQAGDTIACACGQAVEVPKMRELRQLPVVEETRVAEEAAAAAPQWGPREGLILIGTLILIAGLALGGYSLRNYPERPHTPDEIAALESREIKRMPLVMSWHYWKVLEQQGIEPPLPPESDYDQAVAAANQRLLIFFGMAAIGLALTVAGFVLALLRKVA